MGGLFTVLLGEPNFVPPEQGKAAGSAAEPSSVAASPPLGQKKTRPPINRLAEALPEGAAVGAEQYQPPPAGPNPNRAVRQSEAAPPALPSLKEEMRDHYAAAPLIQEGQRKPAESAADPSSVAAFPPVRQKRTLSPANRVAEGSPEGAAVGAQQDQPSSAGPNPNRAVRQSDAIPPAPLGQRRALPPANRFADGSPEGAAVGAQQDQPPPAGPNPNRAVHQSDAIPPGPLGQRRALPPVDRFAEGSPGPDGAAVGAEQDQLPPAGPNPNRGLRESEATPPAFPPGEEMRDNRAAAAMMHKWQQRAAAEDAYAYAAEAEAEAEAQAQAEAQAESRAEAQAEAEAEAEANSPRWGTARCLNPRLFCRHGFFSRRCANIALGPRWPTRDGGWQRSGQWSSIR